MTSHSAVPSGWSWAIVGLGIGGCCGFALASSISGNLGASGVAVLGILILVIEPLQGVLGARRRVTADLYRTNSELRAQAEQLRALAVIMAKMSLEPLATGGRFSADKEPERLSRKQELEKVLSMLGLSDEQMAEATSSWTAIFSMLHIRRAGLAAGVTVGNQENNELIDAAKLDYLSPGALRRNLAARGAITPEVEEWLLDYEHFAKDGTLRRPEVWMTW